MQSDFLYNECTKSSILPVPQEKGLCLFCRGLPDFNKKKKLINLGTMINEAR
uniref:Uncharacterized protein n=1 Tax=Anguilla anguilla TaxID=7936 RepID=A0A0E9Q6L3_ANGAN